MSEIDLETPEIVKIRLILAVSWYFSGKGYKSTYEDFESTCGAAYGWNHKTIRAVWDFLSGYPGFKLENNIMKCSRDIMNKIYDSFGALPSEEAIKKVVSSKVIKAAIKKEKGKKTSKDELFSDDE